MKNNRKIHATIGFSVLSVFAFAIISHGLVAQMYAPMGDSYMDDTTGGTTAPSAGFFSAPSGGTTSISTSDQLIIDSDYPAKYGWGPTKIIASSNAWGNIYDYFQPVPPQTNYPSYPSTHFGFKDYCESHLSGKAVMEEIPTCMSYLNVNSNSMSNRFEASCGSVPFNCYNSAAQSISSTDTNVIWEHVQEKSEDCTAIGKTFQENIMHCKGAMCTVHYLCS